MPQLPRAFFWMILSFSLIGGKGTARADNWENVFSEEERLMGFSEQQRKNSQFDRERLKEAGQIKKDRQEWEEELHRSVKGYKEWKARQAKDLDDTGPEYREDKALKRKIQKELEQFQVDYVRERNRRQALQDKHVLLTEEHEYGLDEKSQRADFKHRTLYGGKYSWAKMPPVLGRSSTGLSNDSGGAPPPPDFGAPPPPPSNGPDFYEPDIPPPPPPEPGSFDEAVPPPIFDEPGDF